MAHKLLLLLFVSLICAQLSASGANYRAFNPSEYGSLNPYGLIIPDADEGKFDPLDFMHSRWGVYIHEGYTPTGVKQTYRFGIPNDETFEPRDFFIVDSLFTLDGYREIGQHTVIPSELGHYIISDIPDDKNEYYLLKKLHFSTDEPWLFNLSQKKNLVILIHGWSPDGDDPYQVKSALKNLSTSLKHKLKNHRDWALIDYSWAEDAHTGTPLLEITPKLIAGHINAPEAAEVGHMHGYHLGKLLVDHSGELEKVHIIAHSAGTWVARSAATYLREMDTSSTPVELQVTLLDPFIPGQVAPGKTSLTKDKIDELAGLGEIRLENYYAVDVLTDKLRANRATSQTFDEWSGADKQLRVDHTDIPFGGNKGQSIKNRIDNDKFHYDGHSGPIEFYMSSVLGTLTKPESSDEYEGEYRNWHDAEIGWTNSLFNNPGDSSDDEVVALAPDLFKVPYVQGNGKTGDTGGTNVEYVQKRRPELEYGWFEASNAAKRAREERYEVNPLPRVGAIFIDPHAVGAYVGHVGMVTAVTQAQFNGQKYYRLLIDDSDAATYQKIRRDVLMWLRLEANGAVVFDPSIRRDGEKYPLYERGESSRAGPERPILFIHEKTEDYNRKRQEIAKFYDLSGGDEVDQIMALRRNLVFYLVDRSGSMKGEGGMLDLRDEVRQRIFEHANNLPANTQVELQFFNSSAGAIKAWHPFKGRSLAQFKAYFEAKFNPDGGTRLFDTVYEAVEHLSGQGLAYNQIEFIIFSDGDDNASGAQAKGQRWKIISPALAQLQQANHFVRTYLFTMGYELAKPDAQTLASMGVEITAVAVEENQKNLEKFDRIELKDGSRYHGKILAKELRFDTNFGSSLVKLGEILSYKSGKLTTRDKFSKAADLSGDDLKIDTAEGSISVPASSVIRVETGR